MIMLGFAAVLPAYAALETPDGYMPEMMTVVAATQQEAASAICVPPDPQYIPAFIRDIDCTIVGISYHIIEYVGWERAPTLSIGKIVQDFQRLPNYPHNAAATYR
ncbi:hypothetical protein [Rhizobium herbae]